MASAGCYSATGDSLEGDTAALSGDGASSNVGSLEGPRGIRDELSDEGLVLYWKQSANWDQGACLEMRLRNNSGCELKNWEMGLSVDQSLTYWADEGGAYFWPQDNLVLVESADGGSLASGGSAVFFFCAEPAVEISGLELRSSSSDCGGSGGSSGGSSDGGSSDGGSADGDDPDPEALSGAVEDAGVRVLYSLDYSDTLSGEEFGCYKLRVQNTTSAAVRVESLDLEMSETVTGALARSEGYATVSTGGNLRYDVPEYRQEIEAGGSFEVYGVCWTPIVPVDDVTVTLAD